MIKSTYSKLKNFYSSVEESQQRLKILYSLFEESQNRLQTFYSSFEESQQKLNASYSFLESQNKLILELNRSIFTLLEEREKKRNTEPLFSFVESVSELYGLWLNVNANFDLWSKCDLILACPATLQGAQELFVGKEIIEITDYSTLKNFFIGARDKQYQSIGIVNPDILEHICNNQTLLIFLLQLSQQQVIFVRGKNSALEMTEVYCLLHKVGFYEILLRNDNKKFCFSTVGHMVGGSFDAFSSVPGTPVHKDWTTHVASRAAISKVEDLPWKTVFGVLTTTAMGSSATPDKLALAIQHDKSSSTIVSKQFIKGVLRWSKYQEGQSTGHASLVGCYSGPSDTNMYAALVEPLNDTVITVSLWRNNGNWELLKKTTVSIENNPLDEQENFSFPLWLKITDSLVVVGTQDKILLSQKDNKLPRTPTTGVRIFGSHISIADLTTDFVKKQRDYNE